jgi:hypothetical protein
MLHNVLANTLDRSLLDTDEIKVGGLPYPLEIGIRFVHARSDINQKVSLHTSDGISETHLAPSYARNAVPVNHTETSMDTKQPLGSY